MESGAEAVKEYKIGLYEKAMPDTLTWREKLECAKACGYDYVEISIDASGEKIDRIHMSTEERRRIVDTMFEAGIPIGSMSVSALTKYALGDLSDAVRKKAVGIMERSIELAADLGIRTVMLPGYDIYFGESTAETKQHFIDNIKKAAEIGAREGVLLGFETMENEFMNTTEKGLEYIDIAASPYLKIYPDAGNITNAAVLHQHDVCEDLALGKGNLIALHLKETVPGVFREVKFLTGHVEFERIISTAWELGVRRYVTELWDTGQPDWEDDIRFANHAMREILNRQN